MAGDRKLARAREWSTTITIPRECFSAGTKNRRGGQRRGGGFYTKTEYKNTLNTLAWLFKSRFSGEPFGWCKLQTVWDKGDICKIRVKVSDATEAKEKRTDVDAILTIIQDALQLAGVIENDNKIKSTEIEKT